jgi:DNA-binding CsgD family transcriptional regulator
LEAIEVVCADDVPINGAQDLPTSAGADQVGPAVRLARSEIRDLLDRLVAQSLASKHVAADTVRYFLLESLRVFAADRLAERSTEGIGESARLARRHCYYYRDKVLRAEAEWLDPGEQELLNWVRGSWPNIRRAIDTSTAAGEPVIGLQICVDLMRLRALFFIGSLPEIQGRIEQILAATQASQPQLTELQLVAMSMLAWLALHQGRPREGEELLERCVAASGIDAASAGHWRDRPEIDIGLPVVIDYTWGIELMLFQRDPRAIAVFARAREKFHNLAVSGGEVASGTMEALAAAFFGSADQAMTIGRRHLERTTAAGAGWERSRAQMALAVALTKHGDVDEALQLGRAALTYQLTHGDRWGSILVVYVRMWSLARLITDQVAAEDAGSSSLVELATEIAYLAGGLKTQRARLGVLIENMGPFADETCAAEIVARDVLGHATYADVEERGSRLSPEELEVQRFALGALSLDTPAVDHVATDSASAWPILSEAEQEVAILAAAGWANSAIGVRRGTSTRTTDAQMSSIFQKLVIGSREEIVHLIPQDQRDRVAEERAHIPRPSRGKRSQERT